MRPLILILILALLAVIVAVASGFLNISQVRGGQAPSVSASENGVSAKGGQAPAFEVETGSVKVGATEANVQLPTLEVSRPSEGGVATNNAM